MRALVLLVGLLLAQAAQALAPSSGWWWNPDQPGRGFTIEVQDNFMFFIGYLYLPDGSATWYVAQGPYDDDNNRFTGELLTFAGGPCITCPYTAAQPGPGAGALTLQFSSTTEGSLTWAGGTLPISRFFFNTPRDATAVNGLWVFSGLTVSGTADRTEWLAFSTTIEDGTLGTVSVGENLTGRNAIAAIAQGELRVLVDGSTSFWYLYRQPLSLVDAQDTLGAFFLYAKGSTPTGTGNLAVGKQLTSRPLTASQDTQAKGADLEQMLEVLRAVE